MLTSTAAVFLLGLAEDARSRRGTDSALIVIGVSRADMASVQRLEIAVRVGLTCALSAGTVLIMSRVSASWVGAQAPPALWVSSLLGALLLIFALAMVLGPSFSRITRPLAELRAD